MNDTAAELEAVRATGGASMDAVRRDLQDAGAPVDPFEGVAV